MRKYTQRIKRKLGVQFSITVTLVIWLSACDLAYATTWDVSITSTGYVPQIVTIMPGDTVRWTNNDSVDREVNSDPHITHADYPRLDFDLVPVGDSVQLDFPESCKRIGYHDHGKEEDVGAIIIGGPCPAREPDKPVFWGIAVTKLTKDSALIEWSTERGSYTQVAYGTKSGSYDISTTVDDMLTKYHRAELTGLSASTTYYFHTIGGMGMDQKFASQEQKFTTLPEPPRETLSSPTNSPALQPASTTPVTNSSTTESFTQMPDMPGMQHRHTGMGVSAYAIRTVRSQIFTTDLHYGQRSESVKKLQEFLIKIGHLRAGLTTGYFGPLTLQAVADYQKSMNLPQTGYFGKDTREMVDMMGG